MEKKVITIMFVLFVAAVCGIMFVGEADTDSKAEPPKRLAVAVFEDGLAAQNRCLLESAPIALPERDAMVSRRYSAKQLLAQPLYLKHKNSKTRFYCFAGTGAVVPETPGALRTVQTDCQVIRTRDAVQVMVDDQLVDETFTDWQIFWISDKAHTAVPEALETVIPNVMVKDGFMRQALKNDNWTVTSGTWKMKQHGGGMAQTKSEEENYSFQRAVNPFSVIGKGVLTYGSDNMIHNRGAACFYFGAPWRIGAVDKNTLPKNAMYVAQGIPGGPMIGFGWDGKKKRFVLVQWEKKEGPITILAEKDAARPPISNWIQIALQVKFGIIAEGILDGKVVLRQTLKTPLAGPFHIIGSDENIEFDDFSITPLKKQHRPGHPIYVRSKAFAGKKEKTKADPEEFGNWARGESAFLKTIALSGDGRFKHAVILSRWPLMGDFEYESISSSDLNGELPPGVYIIELLVNPQDGLPVYDDMTVLFKKKLVYDNDGWHGLGDGSAPMDLGPVLKLRRKAENKNVIEMMQKGVYKPRTYRIDEPLHIAISRVLPKIATLKYPHPEHHKVVSGQLLNDFFEGAPVNWSWIDGAFRMDCRWACQNQWNFMACGSREVPMLVSKRYFSGRQEHEYFMSLRPMLPSDAGDPSFTFSPSLHRPLLGPAAGWYNRHDLNFSFCMDGRNPLSGYSIIFGADGNKETRFIRKGEVVARNKDVRFPMSSNLLSVHWMWWAFSVRKYGSRIIVLYKDKPVFDYIDPEPLDGGHIAFWSVRNGFILSKVASTAGTIEWRPDVLHVKEDDSESNWKPLITDSVSLTTEGDGMTVVTSNVGAGSMAVRHDFRPPIILKRKPNLELPLDFDAGVMVNLYLQIDDTSFVIEVNAPLTGCKSLLTPEFEPDYNIFIRDRRGVQKEMTRNEFFQVKDIPEKTMREKYLLGSFTPGSPIQIDINEALKEKGYNGLGLVRSITVGNSSNQEYLQAGGRANNAGAHYRVGTPTFSQPQQ